MKTIGQKIIEGLEKAGLKLEGPIEIKSDSTRTKEVAEFIRKIEDAHKRAGNSKIKYKYNYASLTNFY